MLMGRRPRRSLGLALAGLVVLALIVVAARRITERVSTLPDTAAAHGVGVARDDDGLRLSLSVPRGPYFRDELLPVTLVLANNSGRPIPLASTYFLGSCQLSPLDVTMTSGGQYLPPVAIGFSPSCGRPPQVFTVLPAGKSLRGRILLGLPGGGRLTLTGRHSSRRTRAWSRRACLPPLHVWIYCATSFPACSGPAMRRSPPAGPA